MKLLLDTHILLWAAGEPARLSESARTLLEAPGNSLFFSTASLWEIVIKLSLGRQDFRVDPHRLRKLLVAHDYGELAITAEHALRVHLLPFLHKDPFDRLLLAQASAEGMALLTGDASVAQYQDSVLFV